MATYDSRPEAWSAKRSIARQIGIFTSVVHCGVCDQYHTVAREDQLLKKEYFRVLSLIAQGYTRPEAAKEIGCTINHLERVVHNLFLRFNALNNAHLIAIAISLGMLNPLDFVPGIKERNH